MVAMVVRETLLRRRVTTRLSWLGVTQTDFARIIGVDKASFSRVMALSPREGTMVRRIALGLGITVEALNDEDNREVLVSDHPAVPHGRIPCPQSGIPSGVGCPDCIHPYKKASGGQAIGLRG